MDRNTLLKSSRAQFTSIFNELIDAAVHRSIETLFEKADKSLNSQEQRHILDARSFIVHNETILVDQIKNNLEILLDRSFQTAYDQFRPSFFNTAKTSPIVLLDISAFEDDLRLEIITNRFRGEAGEQLRDLNIRIAILFERNDIAERENPFRPYLLTRAIVLGVEASHVEAGLFVIITDQFAEELLRNVVKLYDRVNAHLSEAGVAAQLQYKPQRSYESGSTDKEADALTQARKALMPSPAGPVNGNDEATVSNQFARIEHLLSTIKLRQQQTQQQTQQKPSQKQARSDDTGFPEINIDLLDGDTSPKGSTVGGLFNQAGAAVSGWLEGVQEVGDTLRRVFLGGTQIAGNGEGNEQPGDGKGLSPGSGKISPQLNSALRAPLPSMNDMMGVGGEVRNLLFESRDSLNSLASDQHEKMTIDIVAMLFEFILNDHQVPAEVRAQLGRLQFSVLKMALMDSALLTKKTHPARLLVNRIGSISVGLQQIDPSGERISAEICSIVEELLASDAESPELFSKMLDQLDGFIARELLASNASIGNAVNVVVNAENRSKRFEQVNTMLEKLLDGIPVAPYLRRFLLDTWSHAIERKERDSNANATQFRLIVPNLLWSVLPKIGHEDRYLLLQILPSFVSILREGMSLMEWSPQQQQELLNWLVDIHTTVMRDLIDRAENGIAREESVPSLVAIQNHFRDFVYADKTPGSDSPTEFKKRNVPSSFVEEAIKEFETKSNAAGVLENLDKKPELYTEPELSGEANEEFADHPDSDPTVFQSAFSENDEVENDIDSDTLSENGMENKEEDILDRLRSGVVVEINLSGIPTLGRLNWISPNSSNLILTMHGEATPSIISVRMFRRMLKNSRARFVEVAPLFERAVQSLLESADLVDLTHSS